MDWNSLRKRFDSPHLKQVKYKSTKGICLAHKTYAFLYNQDQESLDQDTGARRCAERIEIELFTKTILTLYPDGYFIPNNHEYWKPGTTRDRFRRFLPWSGHITAWSFREFNRINQYTPTRRYAWTLSLAGAGSHPWRNNVVYTSSGHRTDLSPQVNEADANEICRGIQVYAATCVNELYAGNTAFDESCKECRDLLRQLDHDIETMTDVRKSLKFVMQAHFLQHVLQNVPSLPQVLWAVETLGGQKPALAVALQMKENQFAWRRARNKKEVAEQIQHHLLHPEMTLHALGAHPSYYKKWTRWLIEDHLLTEFGFETGSFV